VSASAFATGGLTEILTIPEVAKRAGWSRWRMAKHLKRLNAELGGLLLVNIAHGEDRPRWTISLGALKLAHPQWFQDPESLQRQIDDLSEREAELRLRLHQAEKTIRFQTARLEAMRPTG
jgi:hypothetical protein